MLIPKANHVTSIKSPLNIESPQKKVYKYGFRYFTLLQGFEIRFSTQPTILLRSFSQYISPWGTYIRGRLLFVWTKVLTWIDRWPHDPTVPFNFFSNRSSKRINNKEQSLPTKKGSQARAEQQPFVMKKMRNDSLIDEVDFLNGEILLDR